MTQTPLKSCTLHDNVDVYKRQVFQSHNWPHWGEEIHDYLLNTAAIYKFIHDQTLHYMNQGYTSNEIAAMISLPDALEKVWYTRQYYGTLPHNAKAIYQKLSLIHIYSAAVCRHPCDGYASSS